MEATRARFKKEFRKSRTGARERDGREKSRRRSHVIGRPAVILLIATLALSQVQALRITSFRVPPYVPITLPQQQTSGQQQHYLADLAKPILLDCDYDYELPRDEKLSVRWFRNKETEPFYQWLPEMDDHRYLADWMRPLVNLSFVTDRMEPKKRYRSLLIRRLSMNLTGEYTCVVSSLDGQDTRSSSLVVYQPPRSFSFEHRIFPAPAALPGAPAPSRQPQEVRASGRPTQFKSLAVQVRPANNQPGLNASGPDGPPGRTRVVYTHDGRPVARRSRQAAGWGPRRPEAGAFGLQLHHFQCQATQVTPRPVIVLTVKRSADAIAQYLHEASSASVRPYQVSHADYYPSGGSGAGNETLLVTLYNVTVSATVALNVSLPPDTSGEGAVGGEQWAPDAEQPAVNTVLQFRRGQRMSFECHLEITGTEFEQRRRIAINEDEVFQFAELQQRRLRSQEPQWEPHTERHRARQDPGPLASSGSRGRTQSAWPAAISLALALLLRPILAH